MIRNKAEALDRDRKFVAALAEHFTGSAVLTLGGVSYKVKDMQRMLQDHVDAQDAADALRAKWQTATSVARVKAAKVVGLLPALRAHLLSAYGGSSQIVADFSFTPKPRTTTVAAQAAGVAKRLATRKARGTMGKKQKAKITGVVAPVVTAPASGESAPAPAVGDVPKPVGT